MMKDDRMTVREIFSAAAALADPAEPAAYIDRACGGDAALNEDYG